MLEELRFIFGIFVIIAVVTVVARIISFALCIFSTIQARHLNELTINEIKAIKRRAITGLILDIFILVILLLLWIAMFVLDSTSGGQIGMESTIYIVWILLSVGEIVIQSVNIRKIKRFKLNERVCDTNQSPVDVEQMKIKEKQRSFDLYALIISLLTLPIEAIIGLTSFEEDIEFVDRSDSWKPSGFEKVTYIPEEVKMLMIILLIASIGISLFLVLRNGKNHSNKATWVKMLTVVNIIGGIVILAMP